jgi:hypothetical protein
VAAFEPKVKGTTFRTMDSCFKDLRGEEAWAKAHALMSDEVREAYRTGAILSGGWYPISWYREMFRAFLAATNEGPELSRTLGYRSARIDFKRFHNWILAKLVSPQTLFGFTSKMFNSYFDTGSFEVVQSQRGYVRAEARGCVGWDRNVWNDLIGSCSALLELAGAREVRVRVMSGGRDGDTDADLAAFWVA